MFINQSKYRNHSYFMRLALAQAQKNLGKTNENPSVGCIITKNSFVVSAGCTNINGRPHAEYKAINQSRINLKDAELYVTLDNSNYNFVSQCYGNLHNDSSYVYSHTNLSYILDVTSTSLVKVKFHAQVIDAGVGTEGDTDNNRTSMTFIRLADT